MLEKLIFVLTQKLAVLFVSGLGVLGGFLAMGTVNHGMSSGTAIISNVATPSVLATSSISSTTFAENLPNIPAGLLPTTTVPFCTASSTCGERGLQALIRLSAPTIKKLVTATIKVLPTVLPPVAATTQTPITAQSFLDDTTSSLKILLNGSDELVFATDLGNQNIVTWGLLATTVGGTGSVPAFSVTTSCTPAPNQANPGAVDQNPTFNVRTAYDCTVSLTPQSGADRRTQTKDFSFTTPPGDFLVAPPTSMDTVLVDGTNDGGIIFNNQDSNPITVTNVTFNASYSYLVTGANTPLVLRFQDPATGASLLDYTLTNPTSTDITLPISLTIAPQTQKIIPIQALGVRKMLVLNTTPGVTVTITGVTINRSDVKVVLHNPSIAWSCLVSQAAYDPDATDSAYATGQACLQ